MKSASTSQLVLVVASGLACILSFSVVTKAAGPLPGLDRAEISPFAVENPAGGVPVTALRFDASQFDAIGAKGRVRLVSLPLDARRSVDLELHRVEVFGPNARVVRGTRQGDVPLPLPAVQLFSGRVVGHPCSSAFLGISGGRVNGWLSMGGETHILSSGPHSDRRSPVIYRPAELPADMLNPIPFVCESDKLIVPNAAPIAGPRGPGPVESACRVTSLAIETDYEFTGWLFGGDTTASGAYAATLIGAVSEIFLRDFNVRMQIDYLRLWDEDVDPWDQPDTLNQLFQFQDYWNLEMGGVARNVVHYLSGRGLGGGVAYVPGMCYPGYDYGLSANLGGFFPYPIENNNWANWDLMVVAHELGHNYGAPHTHDMTPPVDGCAFGDCSVTPNGTIMSYCHICPNGLADVRMEMHPRTVYEAILPTLDQMTFCDMVTACDPVGDCNGDGTQDMEDVDCFVDVALGVNTFNGPIQRCDLVNDGVVNAMDAGPFTAAVLAP